jgi:hypothetical protein
MLLCMQSYSRVAVIIVVKWLYCSRGSLIHHLNIKFETKKGEKSKFRKAQVKPKKDIKLGSYAYACMYAYMLSVAFQSTANIEQLFFA